MLSEIALSAALTLGGSTTAQPEMPFTMNFASTPEVIAEEVVNDMDYDPKQQLTTIVVSKKDSSSSCSKRSGSTHGGFFNEQVDYDSDTQQDD